VPTPSLCVGPQVATLADQAKHAPHVTQRPVNGKGARDVARFMVASEGTELGETDSTASNVTDVIDQLNHKTT
jgi:hypothetical protein